jgi:hypothetical protein
VIVETVYANGPGRLTDNQLTERLLTKHLLTESPIDRTPIDRIILKIKIWLNLPKKYFLKIKTFQFLKNFD